MNLSNAVQHFLQRHESNNYTHATYMVVLKFLLEILGDRDVSRITKFHLQEFELATKARPIAKSTVDKYFRVTKSFFNYLVDMDVIDSNPARILKRTYKRTPDRKSKAMSDQDLEKVLSIVASNPRNNAIIRFIADTGCRAGGCATLTLENLDIDHRRALLTEKGDKTRPVFFGETTAAALTTWLNIRPECNHRFVFCSVKRFAYRRLYPTTIGKLVRDACKNAGVTPRGPHSLRHRKGYQMADAKVPPSVAKTALGHERVSTTLDWYYPDDYERAEKAIQSLALTSHDQSQKPDDQSNIIQFPSQKSS